MGRKRGTGKREGMIPTFNRCRSCCRSVPSVAPAAVISRRAAFDRGSPLSFSCTTVRSSFPPLRLSPRRPRDVPSLRLFRFPRFSRFHFQGIRFFVPFFLIFERIGNARLVEEGDIVFSSWSSFLFFSNKNFNRAFLQNRGAHRGR